MRVLHVLWLLAGVVVANPAHAVDWRDLWETPAQRAERRLASGEYRQLAEDAPDAHWEGIARYKAGELDAAATAFDRALQDSPSEKSDAGMATRYNQATVAARQGRYEDAIAGFDTVLEADPTHAAAQHNRGIAEKLQALEEAQEKPSDNASDNGDGEGAEDSRTEQDASADPDGQNGGEAQGEGGPQDPGSDGRQREEQTNAAGEEAGEQGEGEKGDDTRDAQTGAEGGEDAGDPEEDAESAAAALTAEAEAEQSEAGEKATDEASGDEADLAAAPTDKPLSESEQATEQWLRRIPDDPAGLLRRKLQQSHLNDYPEVRGSAERW